MQLLKANRFFYVKFLFSPKWHISVISGRVYFCTKSLLFLLFRSSRACFRWSLFPNDFIKNVSRTWWVLYPWDEGKIKIILVPSKVGELQIRLFFLSFSYSLLLFFFNKKSFIASDVFPQTGICIYILASYCVIEIFLLIM